MSTAATVQPNIFKRCNVSDDLIKRFSKVNKDTQSCLSTATASCRIPMHSSTSPTPTSKTAALEKLLLSVPLTNDVASFSDNDDGTSLTRKFPLYSDHTDVSVCLPSAGYKSAPEGGKYKIRTNSKARKISTTNNELKKNACIKRASSLRATSVTDRVSLIREKLSQSKENSDTEKSKNEETTKRLLVKSNSAGSMNKWNNTCGRTKTTSPSATHPAKTKTPTGTPTGTPTVTRKIFGKGRSTNSFSKIHDTWELRNSNDDDGSQRSKSLSDNEDHDGYQRQRRESRRLKREAYLNNRDKSDSETEPEDGQLTKAGLDRLERRNKYAAMRGRRGRVDKMGPHDENSNETLSDKTLDSGVFDLYLTHLSEDIHKLSKRYDSKEFLDDTLSLKSGYSSASDSLADSIADSVTTLYDSNDEHQAWDGSKTRIGFKNKTKSIISSMNKIAVANATTQNNKITQNNLKSHTHALNPSIATTTAQTTVAIAKSSASDHNNTTSLSVSGTITTKTTLTASQVTNTTVSTTEKKAGYIQTVNRGSNKGDKNLVDTPGCHVKTNSDINTSNDTSSKKNNPRKDVQLTSNNIKQSTQLTSNNIANNLKTSNEAERMELNNAGDNTNKRNEIETDNNFSKSSINDKKSNIKTSNNNSIGINNKQEQINTASSVVNRDKVKKLNTNNNSGQQRALHNGYRDEIDGKVVQQSDNIPDSKTDTDNKNVGDGERRLPASKKLYEHKHTRHLAPKLLRKQDSTELSLLPKTKPSESVKFDKKTRTLVEEKAVAGLHKAVQCVLLDDVHHAESVSEKTHTNEPIIQTTAIDILGQELLDDIHFKYPEHFEPPQGMEMQNTVEEGKDIIASNQLKMDNARLQKLLFEVERARSGTIKALLHVNSLLNKVQGDNAQLKSDIQLSLKEKEALKENLKEMKDQSKPVNAKVQGATSAGERWKRDKMELQTQLNKSRVKAEEADRELLKLRAQYKRVKDQLEHSNNAFTTTLQHNLDATKRLELELQTSLEEKQDLLSRCNEGNRLKREVEALRREMEELKSSHEELQDEKEQLEEKIRHLEKKRRQLLDEEEELQEQISHSQEIIEKLSDAEEALKDRLQKEIKEKEYLQECLEETGQILYQLKINERKLLEDKHVLLYELETEAEEKESLQTTLSKTKTEHQDLIERLQNMTNIHLTVKESLQIANKKEKNYQEQIESLTKTNHILHYTLEKEKEERTDLQEMLEIIDLNYRRMKDETIGKERDSDKKVEKLAIENQRLVEINESLEKKCSQLKASMDLEEESKRILEERLQELVTVKEEVESNLNTMREQQIQNEKKMNHSLKERDDLEENLRLEREKTAKLTKNLEKTKTMLQQVDLELSDARKKLEQFKGNNSSLEEKSKETKSRLKEMENTIQELTELRTKYYNRMNYYETETKQLRKNVNDQTEEIGVLQIGTQRLTRERDKLKRDFDTSLAEFESHKVKCGETLKALKQEVIELSSKVVEKARNAIKHKEQIDNSKSDLQILRKILDADIKITSKNSEKTNCSNSGDNIETINLQVLRDTHDRFRDEFQSHVEKLEDMLKESKTSADTITVVQSPMSKIKLEELKFLRSETFEVHTELTCLKRKINNITVDISDMKIGLSNGNAHTQSPQNKASDELALEVQLSKLNELITKIECRHTAVMNQNSMLLEKTLIDDDVTAKDLVKKFQLVSLQGENRQLKTFIGLLQKKYKFIEEELEEELKIVSQGDKISMSELLSIGNQISNNSKDVSSNGKAENSGSPEILLTTPSGRDLNEQYVNSQLRRNKTYQFFNQMLSPDSSSPNNLSTRRNYSKSYTNSIRSASSTPTCGSDDEDFARLPKRYHSVPRRRRRPRSSYS